MEVLYKHLCDVLVCPEGLVGEGEVLGLVLGVEGVVLLLFQVCLFVTTERVATSISTINTHVRLVREVVDATENRISRRAYSHTADDSQPAIISYRAHGVKKTAQLWQHICIRNRDGQSLGQQHRGTKHSGTCN